MTFEEGRGEGDRRVGRVGGGHQHPGGVGGGWSWAEVLEVRDHEGTSTEP